MENGVGKIRVSRHLLLPIPTIDTAVSPEVVQIRVLEIRKIPFVTIEKTEQCVNYPNLVAHSYVPYLLNRSAWPSSLLQAAKKYAQYYDIQLLGRIYKRISLAQNPKAESTRTTVLSPVTLFVHILPPY